IIIGLLIAIPAMRLKGPYFALGTLMFGFIMFRLFFMGEIGLEEIGGVPFISEDLNLTTVYFIILVIMVASLVFLFILVKSNFGTRLKSIRDDHKGAKASGINIAKYQIIAFAISAFFAGVSGGLFVFFNRYAGYYAFNVSYSFYPIIFTAIGGIATISGPALGTFVFLWAQEILIKLTSGLPFIEEAGLPFALVSLSIVLILMVRFVSNGMLKPLVDNLKELKDILLAK
ncbi:MAG: hypothetical protein GF311_02125, partial [Candidatus Lokiarchaeota archaeon]|nr:hypothetical protein [Candidatus Lokiarchaeota archaeon]